MIFSLLFACSGGKDSEDALPAATLSWLSPAEGDTVAAGDVPCSLVVEEFKLSDPAKHNEGTPIGYIEISVDGTMAVQSGTTALTVPLEAGAHTLLAQLFLADGDAVLTDGTFTCEEDDPACAPVTATISVTAQ